MKRNVYLAMKSLEDAKDLLFTRFGPEKRTGAEEIPAEESMGRVTAEPLFAKMSSPSYHASAMDGIAVRAEETFGINEREPKILEIGRDALWINTGQSIPEGYDAVIMVEKVQQVDENRLEIRSPAFPWQNIRKVGEDIVATQLLLPQNHRIRPYDVGAMISAGIFTPKVWRIPVVAILPTGSELIQPREVARRGGIEKNQIIEYNSHILAGLVRECHAFPMIYDIVPDNEDAIRGAIRQAIDSPADLVIINAGSSAGSKDFTASMIGELGEILAHGVTMMPGKPTILGIIEGKPVIGNPGYTVSATLSFREFVRPLLYRLQGCAPPKPTAITVQPARDIPSKLGLEEFLRVNIGVVGDKAVATPLPRAAGSITTLTRAEGILRIPADSEGVRQGESSEAELLVDEEEILNTVVIIGSHDITVDILADEIRQRGHSIRISSGNVGSLGGLISIKKGVCHMAGTHLLDVETGEYNVSYIRRYITGKRVSLFHHVMRDQGLIVQKGNPRGLQGIADLSREDVTFVNRQAGSGTRVLLDYRLEREGISSGSINGYEREEFTHMAVAVDVLSGTADCGMGIYAAAKALDLDFVPIVREQYDFVIPSEMVDHPKIQLILETVRSDNFRERVSALGGYDPGESGEFWMEVG